MSGGGKQGKDYRPKESRKRGKEEKSESDTSSEGNNKGKETKLLSRRRRKHQKQRKIQTRKSDDGEDEAGLLTDLFRERTWLFTRRH
jgi:hypothetical protein